MIENRDLFWLWTHCREIGMKGKSDSGRMEDDIALFTVTLCDELERLSIRCDGYQASRDWAITTLASALHVETDTVRALEYYARIASEELERLRAENATFKALLRNVVARYDAYRGRGVSPAPNEYERVVDAIERIRAALGEEP